MDGAISVIFPAISLLLLKLIFSATFIASLPFISVYFGPITIKFAKRNIGVVARSYLLYFMPFFVFITFPLIFDMKYWKYNIFSPLITVIFSVWLIGRGYAIGRSRAFYAKIIWVVFIRNMLSVAWLMACFVFVYIAIESSIFSKLETYIYGAIFCIFMIFNHFFAFMLEWSLKRIAAIMTSMAILFVLCCGTELSSAIVLRDLGLGGGIPASVIKKDGSENGCLILLTSESIYWRSTDVSHECRVPQSYVAKFLSRIVHGETKESRPPVFFENGRVLSREDYTLGPWKGRD